MELTTALYVNTLMQVWVSLDFFSKTLRISYYFPRPVVVCGLSGGGLRCGLRLRFSDLPPLFAVTCHGTL